MHLRCRARNRHSRLLLMCPLAMYPVQDLLQDLSQKAKFPKTMADSQEPSSLHQRADALVPAARANLFLIEGSDLLSLHCMMTEELAARSMLGNHPLQHPRNRLAQGHPDLRVLIDNLLTGIRLYQNRMVRVVVTRTPARLPSNASRITSKRQSSRGIPRYTTTSLKAYTNSSSSLSLTSSSARRA